jgi:hypothetical protein
VSGDLALADVAVAETLATAVGLVKARSAGAARRLGAAQAGVEDVAEGVAQHVEAEHGQ